MESVPESVKSLESGRIPEMLFCRICPFFLLFSRNPWNPWKSVKSVGIREFCGIRKSVNLQIRITRETRKNAKRNRETEFLRNYLSSYSRRHITLQHVRYELSVSVHHLHSKQKYAVHVSLWPNTVLNNTSLRIGKSSGFSRAVPALHPHAYCTHAAHYHYTTVHFNTLHYTSLHFTTVQ